MQVMTVKHNNKYTCTQALPDKKKLKINISQFDFTRHSSNSEAFSFIFKTSHIVESLLRHHNFELKHMEYLFNQ